MTFAEQVEHIYLLPSLGIVLNEKSFGAWVVGGGGTALLFGTLAVSISIFEVLGVCFDINSRRDGYEREYKEIYFEFFLKIFVFF